MGAAVLAWALIGQKAAAQAPVSAERAAVMPILQRVELSGSVMTPRYSRVSTDIGGLVKQMHVDLGQRVGAGDAMAQLDASLEELERNRAAAATQEAREELADAKRRLRIAERLVAQDNLPVNEFDSRQAQVRIARARVDRLAAEQARLAERVRRHTVTAPFAGVVALRISDEGEWVAPGDGIVELVDISELYVDVPVPQRYFPQIQADSKATIEVDALPGRRMDARIAARVPVSDPSARSFILRLKPEADDAPLTPGMSAKVALDLATGERGVAVSRDAVIRYPDGRTVVWVLDRGQEALTVSERQVELGLSFDGRIHVKGGLEDGEDVVVRGNEGLRTGQRVRLTGES